MKLETANDLDFDAKVRNAAGLVLVDFTATYCPPCRMHEKVLERVLARRPDVRFVSVNVEDAPNVTIALGVRGTPTLALFEDGALKSTAVGLQSESRVDQLLTR